MSKHDEWYTPPEIIEPIRQFYGGTIDYDIASCEFANRTIKAKYFKTYEDNKSIAKIKVNSELNNLWGNVPYCNGSTKKWIECVEAFYELTNNKQVIMLVNRSDAQWYYDFLDSHQGGYYQFRKRIKFIDGLKGERSSPRYNNDLIYWGKKVFEFQSMCAQSFGKPVPATFDPNSLHPPF